MFLNLTLASGHTSPIIASGILNPVLAYLFCSRALHVKYRPLSEDLITLPNIGAWHKFRHRLLYCNCSVGNFRLKIQCFAKSCRKGLCPENFGFRATQLCSSDTMREGWYLRCDMLQQRNCVSLLLIWTYTYYTQFRDDKPNSN